jgi:hypothetical protein
MQKGGACLQKYCQAQSSQRKEKGGENIGAENYFSCYICKLAHKCGIYHKFNSIQRSNSFVIYLFDLLGNILQTAAYIPVFFLTLRLLFFAAENAFLTIIFVETLGLAKSYINNPLQMASQAKEVKRLKNMCAILLI